MEIKEKLKIIQKDLNEGGLRNTIAAKECVQTIEFIFQDLFHRDLTKLKPEDREKALEAEKKIGRNIKGIKDFTMGELIGLYRNSDFLRAWADAAHTDIRAVLLIDFAELNKIRNALMHKNLQVSSLDAFFLFSCLLIVYETFAFEKNKISIEHKKKYLSPRITPDNCIKALEQALKELYTRDLTKLDDKKRQKIQQSGFEVSKDDEGIQKGVEKLEGLEFVEFYHKTGFIKIWADAVNIKSNSIYCINIHRLYKFGKKLASDKTIADSGNVIFFYSCCLVIYETFAIRKQAPFVHDLQKAVNRPRTAPVKKYFKWLTAAVVIAALISIFFTGRHILYDTARLNKIAENEAVKFYTSAKKSFEKNAYPAFYDKTMLPYEYEKNPEVEFFGKLVLGVNGQIMGKMKFSHKKSEDFLVLNQDGVLTEKDNSKIITEQVEIFDIITKNHAENFCNSILNNPDGIYDKTNLPQGFKKNPDINYQGKIKLNNNKISGKISFSHKNSSSVFYFDQSGKIQIEKTKPVKEPETNMEFVWLPGGCYEMGCAGNDCFSHEKPLHIACVNGFWLGKFEVTQGQWQNIITETPSVFKLGNDYPVENISWDQVKNFISILNKNNNGRFRLPTEAEWEYACQYGGIIIKTDGISLNSTHPSGISGPDKSGAYEIADNVLEWCEDSFYNKAYNEHVLNNPIYKSQGVYKVVRGKSWASPYGPCSHRFKYAHDEKSAEVGFRLVLEQINGQ